MFVRESLCFPSLSKTIEISLDTELWVDIFFFRYLKMSLCCLLACMVSDEKSAVVHILLPLLVRCFIFLWLPWRFSLCLCFLWVWICLGVYMGVFLCVCFCIYSVWCLLPVTDFGKFLAIISSSISFVLFFLFLLVFHLCTCYMTWYCSKLLDVLLCFTHSFSFCFSSIALFFFFRWNGILIILCPIFNFNDFFLYCVKFTDESAKGILHVFCFWSWHFHLILSYIIHLCWSCMLPTFSMRAFNIWISYFKCPIW